MNVNALSSRDFEFLCVKSKLVEHDRVDIDDVVLDSPQHIRSDNGLEFVAKTVRRWLQRADVWRLLFTKGSPWKNGYVESVGGKLRDELLNQELLLSLAESSWVIDRWRLDYNHHRIHSVWDYQTPAAYAVGCVLPASAMPQPPEQSRVT